MIVLTVVGARPQFIKAALVSRALETAGVREVVVHTGQHYDVQMSDVFFRQLRMRDPDYNLGVGSGGHGEQTGLMLSAIERVLQQVLPDRVLVYGDTNSTLAGSLAAVKLRLPVDHIEAGLRSYDRDMPEEINRVLTDQLSDQLMCPTQTAVSNLRHEGITEGVLLTGDVMLDLALEMRPLSLQTALPAGVQAEGYFVATLHRPSNTDEPLRLRRILTALDDVAGRIAPVVLPVHPRLAAAMKHHAIATTHVRTIAPLGYLEMQGLVARSRAVITDSGGVQKEALFHGKQCLTLRDSTEWLETVQANMNVLLGDNVESLCDYAASCGGVAEGHNDALALFGNGRASACIADAVVSRAAERRRWAATANSQHY